MDTELKAEIERLACDLILKERANLVAAIQKEASTWSTGGPGGLVKQALLGLASKVENGL